MENKNMSRLLEICKDLQHMDRNGEYMEAYDEVCRNELSINSLLEEFTQIVSNWLEELDPIEDKVEYHQCMSIFRRCMHLNSNNVNNMSNEQILDRIVKDNLFNIQWFDNNPSLRRRICQRWNECVNNYGNKEEIDILGKRIDEIERAMQEGTIK